MRARLAILLLVLAAVFPFAKAGIHKDPLDPEMEASKCLECHKEQSAGKAVHSALKSGCLACHEVRVNNNVTRVRLKTSSPARLCIQCHSEKDASDITGRVHAPAIRDCLKCHNPHTSDNQNHLVKPVAGSGKDDSICLTCHSYRASIEDGGSRHPALDKGCDVCHTVHKTGQRGKREFDYQLKKDTPALCMDCHDRNDAGLIEAHQGQPFETGGCLECHDPHQSTRLKLKPLFVHEPFEAGKDSCAKCHQPPRDGKVVLNTATPKELCLDCHSKEAEQIRKATVKHTGVESDCTQCHTPHAAKAPGLPKPDAVRACLRCHDDQAARNKKRYLHQPAFGQGCYICHEPHGSENKNLLHTSSANALCLECHGPDSKPEPLKEMRAVTIFNGRVKLPEGYFSIVPKIAIKYGLDHPIQRHPVADQMDPGDNTRVRAAINCLSCHQPHASMERFLLVKDQANGIQFCAGCHKDMGK